MSVSEMMPESPYVGWNPSPSGKPAPGRSRVRFNQAMRVVRRSHLYAGLFMTPWVFLYGVTGLLFNHPSVFPDQAIRSIEAKDFEGTPLETPLVPRALAAQVVEAINESGGEDSPSYKLIRADEADFAREYFTTIPGEGENHSVRIDLKTGAGTIRSVPGRTEGERPARPPFATRPVRLASSPMDAITKSLGAVLARKGLPPTTSPSEETLRGRGDGEAAGSPGSDGERRRRGREESTSDQSPAGSEARGRGEARPDGARRKGEAAPTAGSGGSGEATGPGRGGRGASGPELNFFMEGAGKVWQVGYNLQTGALSGRPEGQPSQAGAPLSNRRFLLRLHTAHGFSSEFDARWFWAFAVDVMSFCMVGWGVTGLLMWWQMKNVRKAGAVLIALSVVVSLASVIGMHGSMTNP